MLRYALETYSNEELVAINQDPLGSPAKRIVGGDLSFPCKTACNSTNVWGRQLSGGKFALGFVNNAGSAAKITCDGSCFDALNISSSVAALKVRDLWAHADVATLTRPFTFTAAVNGSGFAAAYKLTPSAVTVGL
jgi:alpha-galactosidase